MKKILSLLACLVVSGNVMAYEMSNNFIVTIVNNSDNDVAFHALDSENLKCTKMNDLNGNSDYLCARGPLDSYTIPKKTSVSFKANEQDNSSSKESKFEFQLGYNSLGAIWKEDGYANPYGLTMSHQLYYNNYSNIIGETGTNNANITTSIDFDPAHNALAATFIINQAI